jgi:hypothetical protein
MHHFDAEAEAPPYRKNGLPSSQDHNFYKKGFKLGDAILVSASEQYPDQDTSISNIQLHTCNGKI